MHTDRHILVPCRPHEVREHGLSRGPFDQTQEHSTAFTIGRAEQSDKRLDIHSVAERSFSLLYLSEML